MLGTCIKLARNHPIFIGSRYKSAYVLNRKYDHKYSKFVSEFRQVLDTVTPSHLLANLPLMSQHFADVLEYNVLKEKRFRPSIVIDTYTILERPENLTEERLDLANILAWCIELYHTSYIMNDDVMDGSQLRGNGPSWYLKKEVGLNAINDSIFVLEASLMLLEKYFSASEVYRSLQSVLSYTRTCGAIGQGLDWKCNNHGKFNYDFFNTDIYNLVVYNKSCVPFVEGPFKAAMVLANRYDNESLDQIIRVLQKLGQAFQIDNDVLDIYNNGRVRKHIGSDIREGKCSWLAVQVLESGNKELIRIFKENYGKLTEENERKVVDVYLKMKLFDKYLYYKNDTINFLNREVEKMTDSSLQQATFKLAENIFPNP